MFKFQKLFAKKKFKNSLFILNIYIYIYIFTISVLVAQTLEAKIGIKITLKKKQFKDEKKFNNLGQQ